jgi:hypothetical protein
MTQLVRVLKKHGKIDETMFDRVLKFVAENRFDKPTKGSGDIPANKAKAVSFRFMFFLKSIYLTKKFTDLYNKSAAV